MKYLVGKQLKIPGKTLNMGDLAPREAETWRNLHSLVAAGFLYPYVPEAGYAKLPPHLFNAVRTRQEVLGLIKKGQEPIVSDWTTPELVQQSIDTQEAEKVSHEKNLKIQARASKKMTEKLEETQIAPRPTDEIQSAKQLREATAEDSKKDEAEAAGDAGEKTDYNLFKKDDLIKEIEDRNAKNSDEEEHMSTEGYKSELVERLVADDLKN